jgi:hypothetical protein
VTVGHLVFSIVTSGYILVGIFLEERDRMKYRGADYDLHPYGRRCMTRGQYGWLETSNP